MRYGRSLFWLPVTLLWALVKTVALPAVAVWLSWWLLPDRWAQVVTAVAVLYMLGVAVVAGVELRGRLRSMARGTFTIRDGRWDR